MVVWELTRNLQPLSTHSMNVVSFTTWLNPKKEFLAMEWESHSSKDKKMGRPSIYMTKALSRAGLEPALSRCMVRISTFLIVTLLTRFPTRMGTSGVRLHGRAEVESGGPRIQIRKKKRKYLKFIQNSFSFSISFLFKRRIWWTRFPPLPNTSFRYGPNHQQGLAKTLYCGINPGHSQ